MARRKSEHTNTGEKQNTRAYTDEQKIACLTAMISNNPDHPYCAESIAAATALLGTKPSLQTLHDWMIEFNDTVRSLIPKRTTDEIVLDTYNQVTKQWANVEKRYLDHLTDDYTVLTSSARDAVIAAGTARDKIDKFKGLSPDIMIEIQGILKACELGALDPKSTLADFRQHLTQYVASRSKVVDTTSIQVIPTDKQDER